jgi:Bacteriophage protein GP30.3
MDIRSGGGYPCSALSNFAPHRFVLDGVECASMEGLLQSLKFDKAHIQVEVCKLIGKGAKYRGRSRNAAWQRQQVLWWQGKTMKRDGPEYQEFLDRAFDAMAGQCESFQNALLATQDATITHSIGKTREADTVLTQSEFCSRLMKIRARLQDASTPTKSRS